MPEGEVRGGVEHGEGGRFQDKYSDNQVLKSLIESHPEPLTNQEVANRVGCVKATAHNRLHELDDQGQVATKKVGAKARVWWVDLTRPARDFDGLTDHLEDLNRAALARVASRFEPPFNPTRTGTEDIQEFLLGQPYADLDRELTVEAEADGE